MANLPWFEGSARKPEFSAKQPSMVESECSFPHSSASGFTPVPSVMTGAVETISSDEEMETDTGPTQNMCQQQPNKTSLATQLAEVALRHVEDFRPTDSDSTEHSSIFRHSTENPTLKPSHDLYKEFSKANRHWFSQRDPRRPPQSVMPKFSSPISLDKDSFFAGTSKLSDEESLFFKQKNNTTLPIPFKHIRSCEQSANCLMQAASTMSSLLRSVNPLLGTFLVTRRTPRRSVSTNRPVPGTSGFFWPHLMRSLILYSHFQWNRHFGRYTT